MRICCLSVWTAVGLYRVAVSSPTPSPPPSVSLYPIISQFRNLFWAEPSFDSERSPTFSLCNAFEVQAVNPAILSPCSVAFASGYSHLWLLPSGPIHGGGPLPLAGHWLLDHPQNPGRESNCLPNALRLPSCLLSYPSVLYSMWAPLFANCFSPFFFFFFQINSPPSLALFETTISSLSVTQTRQADFCSLLLYQTGASNLLFWWSSLFYMLRIFKPNFKLFRRVGQK